MIPTTGRQVRLSEYVRLPPSGSGTPDEAGAIRLWVAVAEMALADLHSQAATPQAARDRDSARDWFRAGHWALLCDRLGWDVQAATAAALRPRDAVVPPVPVVEAASHGSRMARARAWVRARRAPWHRAELAAVVGGAAADWILQGLRREGLIVSVRWGWWRRNRNLDLRSGTVAVRGGVVDADADHRRRPRAAGRGGVMATECERCGAPVPPEWRCNACEYSALAAAEQRAAELDRLLGASNELGGRQARELSEVRQRAAALAADNARLVREREEAARVEEAPPMSPAVMRAMAHFYTKLADRMEKEARDGD